MVKLGIYFARAIPAYSILLEVLRRHRNGSGNMDTAEPLHKARLRDNVDNMKIDPWAKLEAVSLELLDAQSRARTSRAGVSSQFAVLQDLAETIIKSNETFEEWRNHLSADQNNSNNQGLIFLQFTIRVARACSQYLEYAKEFPRLPAPGTNEMASREFSEQYRYGFLKVIENCHMMLQKHLPDEQIIMPFQLELHVLKLKAIQSITYHEEKPNKSVKPEQIIARAEEIFHEAVGRITDKQPDPEEIYQWCAIGACSIVIELDKARGAELLSAHDLSTFDDAVSWELNLIRVQALSGTSSWQEAVASFITALQMSRTCDETERFGRAAMATRPVHHVASELIDRSETNLAFSLLESYNALNGIEETTHNLLSTFLTNDTLYAILSTEDDTYSIKTPLQAKELLPLIEASAAGNADEAFRARKRLGVCLRELITNEKVVGAVPLTIDPQGFSAWIPWQALPTGTGRNFGEIADLRWRHPRSASRNTGNIDMRSAVLVVDESLSESAHVVQAWRQLRGDASEGIVTFSSERNDFTEEKFRQKFEHSSFFVYYGHGVSDPEDATQRGLYLGPDNLVTNASLRRLDGNSISAALIIACESGRGSPFLAGSAPAHAIASSGVSVVVSSLWAIWARDGARYSKDFFKSIDSSPGIDVAAAWRDLASNTTNVSTPFYCIQ